MVNGTVYVIGGSDSNNPRSEVLYAHIDAGGDIDEWKEATNLDDPRAVLGVATDGRFIYAVGGFTTGKRFLNTVEYAEILTDGSFGLWMPTSPLTGAGRVGHAVVRRGSFLYSIGGRTEPHDELVPEVQVAELLPDGGLGPWRLTAPIQTGRNGHAAATSCGRIYLSGGENRGTLSDVQFTN